MPEYIRPRRGREEATAAAQTITNKFCMLCGNRDDEFMVGVCETTTGIPGLLEAGSDVVYLICQPCFSKGITLEKATLIEEAILADLRSKRIQ